MQRGQTGDWEPSIPGGENVRAFVPHVLPPMPPLEFSAVLREKWDLAHLTLGRQSARDAMFVPTPPQSVAQVRRCACSRL